jgi:XTP/dITP diphosphohydrolase
MTVWFATGNLHKKKELGEILSAGIYSSDTPSCDINLLIPGDAGLDFDPEETGTTVLENALLKAEVLYKLLDNKRPSQYTIGDPIIADDSGICVDALNGSPGIYSARYGGADASAAKKNSLLLKELGDNPNRKARFVCAMVLYYGPNRFYTAQECLEGEIVRNAESARGRGGFGYDPVLYLPEYGCTVAELGDGEKNRLSHRGKAGKIISAILRYAEPASNGIAIAGNIRK